jgi:hypothetical protein
MQDVTTCFDAGDTQTRTSAPNAALIDLLTFMIRRGSTVESVRGLRERACKSGGELSWS